MKKLLSFVLVLILLVISVPIGTFSVSATTYSGSLSSTVFWKLNTDESTLTIYGTGAIPDQPNLGKPWSSYDKYIKHIVIEDGITKIGGYAFSEMRYFEDIVIPQGVTGIGDRVFQYATAMKTIYIPLSCTSMGFCAFNYCWGLTDVYYEGTESQFNAISKSYAGIGGFDHLFSATKHYNYDYDSRKQGYDATKIKSITDILLSVYDKNAFSNVNVVNAIKNSSNAEISGAKVQTTFVTYLPNETDNRISISYENCGSTGTIVSKDNYYNYIIPYDVTKSWQLNSVKATDIFMTKDANNEKPFVSTVFARNCKSNNSNIESQYLEVQTNQIQIINGSTYDVIISADNYNSSLTYFLAQDDTLKISNNTGIFESIDLYSCFEKDKDIYAYVKNSDGLTSSPVKLKFEKIETSNSFGQLLTSNTFNLFGNSGTKITLSDDAPLVGGLGIDLDASFPIGVQFENNKVRISFGMDIFNLKSSNGGASEFKWSDFKKSCQTLNNIDKSLDSSQDKIDNYKYLFKHYKGKYGIDSYQYKNNSLNMDVLGYIEAQIESDGTFHVTECCGTVAADFAFKYTQQTSVWVVPAYFYVEAGISTSVQFKGAKVLPDSDVPFDFGITLNVEPEIKLGGGAGIKGAVSAGILGEGSMPFENNFSTKYRNLKLKGAFKAEAEFFVLRGDLTLLSGTKTLIDEYYGSNYTKFRRSSCQLSEDNSQEKCKFELMPRDYLESTISFMGNSTSVTKRQLKAKTLENKNITVLQSSIFSNTQTQIVEFDGKLLMAWVEDNAARDAYNRMRLMFSIYDTNTNMWSAPQAVDDTGTLDSAPSLATDGKTVYIAWQNIKNTISSDDEDIVASILASSEIKFAQYNPTSNSFEKIQVLTDNNTYDYCPSVSVQDSKVSVCWVNTSSNTFSNKSFSINRINIGNSTQTQYDGLNYIFSMISTNSDISYIMDLDGNTTTSDDICIFRNGENISTEINLENMDMAYGNIAGENVVFFVDNGNLYYESNGVISQVTTEGNISENLQVVQSTNNITVIWTQNHGNSNDIYVCNYDGKTWGGCVKLTNISKKLSHIASAYCDDKLNIIYNQTELLENTSEDGTISYENGQTDLCSFIVNDYYDLSIKVPYIDESAITEEGNIDFDLKVTNNGTKTINEINFTISDGRSDLNTKKNIELLPGQSSIIALSFMSTAISDISTLTVTATLPDLDDVNLENNIEEYNLGNCDLLIQDLTVQTVGTVYKITGLIYNNNCISAEDVAIKLMRNGKSYTINIGKMFGKEGYLFEYFIDKSIVEYTDGICAVNIEVITTTAENITDNNVSNIFLIYDSNNWTSSKTTTCSFGEHTVVEYPSTPSTCTQSGNINYCRCTLCYKYFSDKTCNEQLSYSDIIVAPTGHTGKIIEIITPTCVDRGYSRNICNICNSEYDTDYVEAIGHIFSNDICLNCQQHSSDCIESSHDYSNNCDQAWTITKENAAQIIVTFSYGTVFENNYDFLYIYDAEDNLVGKYTGTQLSAQSIAVNGNTVKLRLTSDGSVTKYGFAISKVETLTQCQISNHTFSEEYTLDFTPTKDSVGKISRHCEYCDSVTDIQELPYLKISGATLTLYDDISVNYMVSKDLFEGTAYTNPYMVFEFNGKQTKVTNYTISGNYYCFSFANIAPDKMNDTIKSTLYASVGDNMLSSDTREYSIAEYCYSMLDYYSTDAYANLRTLLVDLLNYGAYTQNYTGHNTENLVNANLTDEQKAWASGDIETFTDVLNTKYATVDNPTVKWRGAELELNSAITMKFVIQADSIEGLTVKITDDNGHSWTVKSSTFKKYADGYYCVYFNGLDASQMSDNIYLTVYSGDTIVSNTVRYSIESYASAMKDSTNDKLSTLVHSMMKYGNSAKQYKNKGVN